jgi:hypothetical protein
MNVPIYNMGEVKYITSMCHDLEELFVEICGKVIAKLGYDLFDPFDEEDRFAEDKSFIEAAHGSNAQDLQKMSMRDLSWQRLQKREQQEQMKLHSKIKKLMLVFYDVRLDFP